MPAYAQHHEKRQIFHAAMTVCPSCLSLPMQIIEVQPHWDLARVDFVYECPACCTEVRETVAKH
jgi:hypothetical protein